MTVKLREVLSKLTSNEKFVEAGLRLKWMNDVECKKQHLVKMSVCEKIL